MKKQIFTAMMIIILLIIAIPASLWGIAEIGKQAAAQTEAKTAQMRVQIDVDNAALIRQIAWTGVLVLLVNSSLSSGALLFLTWHGIGLRDGIKDLATKTRVLMRRAK